MGMGPGMPPRGVAAMGDERGSIIGWGPGYDPARREYEQTQVIGVILGSLIRLKSPLLFSSSKSSDAAV